MRTVTEERIAQGFEAAKAWVEKMAPGSLIRPREFQVPIVHAGLALSEYGRSQVIERLVAAGLVLKQSDRMLVTPGGPEPEKSLRERVRFLEERMAWIEDALRHRNIIR